MSGSVISRLQKLAASFNGILDRERRERLAVGSKDRERSIDAVGAKYFQVDVCSLGSRRVYFGAFRQKSLL